MAFLYFLLTIALINSVNGVNSLAMSADGKEVVTGSYLGRLSSFQEMADGTWFDTVRICNHTIRFIAISLPTAVKVVGFEQNKLSVIKDDRLTSYNLGLTGREIAMSANGKYVVANAANGTFIIFEFDDNYALRVVRKLPNNYNAPARCMNITDNAQEIRACFADGEVIIYQSNGHTWQCYELVNWSPDHSKIWTTSLASTPDGRLLVGGAADGKLYIWTKNACNRLQLLTSMNGSQGTICSLAISRDGTRFVSGSLDGEVKIWQSTAPNVWQIMGTLSSAQTQHATVAMSADGERIVKGVGGTIEVWQSLGNNDWHCIYTARGLEN